MSCDATAVDEHVTVTCGNATAMYKYVTAMDGDVAAVNMNGASMGYSADCDGQA